MKSMGAFPSRERILAIDTHDVMYYGDPRAEGVVVGIQPKRGSHWAYKLV